MVRQLVEKRFFEKEFLKFPELLELLQEYKGRVFRGQLSSWSLQTSLEREILRSGLCLNEAATIERKMVRDFRRAYSGTDSEMVRTDTLYCLSLMQHHCAPTRLLDWTYSPFVAAYFALEYGYDNLKLGRADCAVWCLNEEWCLERAKEVAGNKLMNQRNNDKTRDDRTFKKVYLRPIPRKLVFLENPIFLH